ncbi:hypothetical protein Pmar_PMAR005340 [Perkinsus marinus ATCC 50983]|uniref:C2 domain-containing protein n=1 Tax=Perkinsus marinus (strain ATCC 50983 / TXsc) TaxID=423536 RepID=C5KBA3_PERM5|nr:hypothetical protein Pmar_PMAR005340 [Perkinsus marinus ATCC 50983]EER18429.1 hypothetical protein Pmar_PMAR005340 [Perkinsus marinus ATCC 50983]|eukprot:XP_002786633.1 hypothetical protein Pmar_PMAR005340 [Perkinsus marinus ATCC 50983]
MGAHSLCFSTQEDAKEAIGRMLSSGFGRLDGKIGVDHRPLYRQTGELCDMSESKAYLLIKVIKVDRILTAQQRPLNEMDTYVQVTFDGMSYSTDVVQDELRPEFKQDFYFEIRVANPAALDAKAILDKGTVMFDVWLDASEGSGVGGTDHCGWAEMDLSEIFNDGTYGHIETISLLQSFPGKMETQTYYSVRSGVATDYETKVSHIYVEAWLKPFDFPEDYRVLDAPEASFDYLPPKLIGEWSSRVAEWNNRTSALNEADARQFIYQLKGQRGRLHYLSVFLDVMKPPSEVDNRNAVYFWVRCFPYVDAMPVYESLALAPDFTMSLQKGDSLARALLHCSLLLGVGEAAFVCIGTTWDRQPAYWVMTMEFDGSITFWDATIGRRSFGSMQSSVDDRNSEQKLLDSTLDAPPHDLYLINSQHHETESLHWKDRTWKPVLFAEHPLTPYRTIDVVFNKSNVWANLQNPDPTRIYYDLWNNNYWHPFSTTLSEMQPFFSSSSNRMPRSDQWMEDNRREVYSHIHEAIEAYRQNQSSTVVWQKDAVLTSYLEKGLQLMFQYEIASDHDQPVASERMADWRRLLYSKVPNGMNLICLPMFFNYTSPKDVADGIVARCGFLNCREAGTQFTVAVHLDRMPNRLVALFVCVAMIHNMPDLQIQEVLARRQKEQREQDIFADEDYINLIQMTEANAAAWDNRDSDDILTRDIDYIVERIEGMQAGDSSVDFGVSRASTMNQSSGALASMLNDAHREDRIQTPSGWADEVHSEYVKLTDRGIVAEYRKDVGAEKNELALGMVIGDAPVEHFRFIGWYFEVKLLERQELEGDEWDDGLTLGVTSATPEDILAEGIPWSLADLDGSWSMGYDGRSYCSDTDVFEDLE